MNVSKYSIYAGAVLLSGCQQNKETDQKYPNFIVIFTDDQGYNDLGCYGSTLIRTPNIDLMAAEGIRFINFYSQPISGAARVALLTGCYPLRTAEVGNEKRLFPMLHPDEIIIPEVLKTKGYVSGCIGKWDIMGREGPPFLRDDLFPTEMGFDYWYGVPASNDGGINVVYRNKDVIFRRGDKFTDVITVDTITQVCTAEALRFIEENKGKPFFLYIPTTMPHTRLGASSGFKGKSRAGLYGDAIEELDWCAGEIRKKVEELGLANNTYIIYTSDNGPWLARGTHGGSAYPLRGEKISTWEGGVRVPCIVWSGAFRKKGQVCHQVATTMDFLPTFASMAQVELPTDRKIDGQDITSLLTGIRTDFELKDEYYYYMDTHLQAVRQGEWKLVFPRPQAPEWIRTGKKSIWIREDMDAVRDIELYNLVTDPGERRDIAASHPDIVQQLLILAEKVRNDIGDYNQTGNGVRFFDEEERRPDAHYWYEKEQSGWKQEIKLHPYYNDGGRIL